jgi:ATP-dependent DNA helicase RecQ
VLLSTLHGIKGMELPHVLIADGGWRPEQRSEEERRLFYVGMTRARETLTLGSLTHGNPWIDELQGDWLLHIRPRAAAPPPEVVARRYALLTPADLDIGYAGRQPPSHPIQASLSALETGDSLQARAEGQGILLCNGDGLPVVRLSRKGATEWMPRLEQIERIRIVALLGRRREDGDPAYREQYRCEDWALPLVEVRFRET